MYLTFDVGSIQDLSRVKHDIQVWASRYLIAYTQKTIKNKHRLAFNRAEDFTLFYLTWQGLPYEIVNLGNEQY
jgi:hypothetical protein